MISDPLHRRLPHSCHCVNVIRGMRLRHGITHVVFISLSQAYGEGILKGPCILILSIANDAEVHSKFEREAERVKKLGVNILEYQSRFAEIPLVERISTNFSRPSLERNTEDRLVLFPRCYEVMDLYLQKIELVNKEVFNVLIGVGIFLKTKYSRHLNVFSLFVSRMAYANRKTFKKNLI